MSIIQLEQLSVHVYGEFLTPGDELPDVSLVSAALETVRLLDVSNSYCLINVCPSIDTAVCFDSIQKIKQIADVFPKLDVFCISIDTPFALARLEDCDVIDTGRVLFLSDYQNRDFGAEAGLVIADGPVAGFLARAVFLCNPQKEIVYSELVPNLQELPDFACLENKLASILS